MLYDQIQADYIAAMKAHETVKKDALNYVFAQCKNKKIELQKELEDADVIAILKKEIKAREESIWYLEQAGKIDDVEKEKSIITYKNKIRIFQKLKNIEQCPHCLKKPVLNIILDCGHEICTECYIVDNSKCYHSFCK